MKNRTTESELRNALLRELKCSGSEVIAEEVKLEGGDCVADVVASTPHITGFEIKSDFDSFDSRFARQVQIYQRVFHRVYLVCGAKHLEDAFLFLPPWWGILVSEYNQSGISLKEKRSAAIHTKQDPYSVASILSKEYGIEMLRSSSLSTSNRVSRDQIWRQITENFNLQEIEAAAAQSLNPFQPQNSRPNLFESI